MGLRRRETMVSYLFLSPALLCLLVFVVIPTLVALYLSFTEYTILRPPRWIGVSNYLDVFRNEVFLKAFKNTFRYAVIYVPGKIILSLLLAVLLNQRFLRWRGGFLTAYYIPTITSMTAASFIWLWLYQPDTGLLNGFLRLFGLGPYRWIYSVEGVMPSVAAVTIWKDFGHSTVLLLAGLQGIPGELYEAAAIDGANAWDKFVHVTIPLLKPVLLLVLLTSIIMSFQVFTAIYIMTAGGPMNASTTVVHQIYVTAFDYLKMGRASAMSFVLFFVMLIFSIPQFRLLQERL
ncbi:MAG: sugar ABC transporter permease [Firmicutes bacterium]|nr:sugar ABC transporter permease [Bacillota bacterium]